ncbi:MAG TPA: hypothetical protein VFJ15_05665 [Oleiagrimonas sp.]|nr:hypothetical protein [Oleiagrimonas sp.]
MSMRLTGSAASIDAMLDVLRGSAGVESIVELGVSEMPHMSEDSSSAELPSDTHTGARDVEVHVIDEAMLDNVRTRIEAAAHDAGVVVEWLESM